MSRGIKTKHNVRKISGDLVYNDTSIAKLINKIMYDGEKQKASKIVYEAIKLAYDEASTPELSHAEFINKVIVNIEPSKVAIKRVVKGRSLMIPKDINAVQRRSVAISLMVNSARALRKEKGIAMSKSLSIIIVDGFKQSGKAIEMKKSLEAAAEVNKAYKM